MDLQQLRAQIDAIDRQLVSLLEQRMDVSTGVAQYKQAHGLPVLDRSREAEKLASVRAMCRPETERLIADVFESVLAASRARQTGLIQEADNGK